MVSACFSLFSPGSEKYHNQTPVRADSVWSLLTLDNVNQLDGGWQPVPTDIFRQVTPTERFRGRRMESCPAT
ncbi:hypothetical protein V9798_24565, partial [Escherichia coli]